VRLDARPLSGAPADYDALLERIGDARLVPLGEASHGSHELYRERIRITRRLIAERGFVAVAIEGDWPDAHRVNRFVQGAGADADAEEAPRGFRRFPTWMWRNTDVVDFTGWLGASWSTSSGWKRDARGSYEAILHAAGVPAFLLCPLGASRNGRAPREPRLERPIGVIYRPATERASHYLTASLSRQFDALVHVDTTRAVEPLERTRAWELGEPPETYPRAV
jgi:erythromycin esterase-like protein